MIREPRTWSSSLMIGKSCPTSSCKACDLEVVLGLEGLLPCAIRAKPDSASGECTIEGAG
jgi:hypothetical protein